jgi:Ni/Fe-hydrogenase subunit HybB-like protein
VIAMPSFTSAPSNLRRAVVLALGLLVTAGAVAYSVQLRHGLGVTGLSRAVPWGLYISQFTFFVGVAASSVLVVLPRHVHGRPDGEALVSVGEAVAISALVAAFSFVLVDLGRPARVLGVLLYAAPTSLMFWDVLTLSGYLGLCATVLGGTLLSPRGTHPRWLRVFVLASIPFAFGIHVVTALLYSGLVARTGFLSALLAPKFLATAFASGSALLLLLGSALDARRAIHVPPAALARLAALLTYALAAAVLFTALEVFTALYSGLPAGAQHLSHLFVPTPHSAWTAVPTLTATTLSVSALGVLLVPPLRARPVVLRSSAVAVLVAVFLEKGFVFVPSGFFPLPLGGEAVYAPSWLELTIATGIHAGAALIFLTLLAPIVARARAESPSPTAAATQPHGLGAVSDAAFGAAPSTAVP